MHGAAIVENMTELRPEVCVEAVQQGLMQYIFKRLRVGCGTRHLQHYIYVPLYILINKIYVHTTALQVVKKFRLATYLVRILLIYINQSLHVHLTVAVIMHLLL